MFEYFGIAFDLYCIYMRLMCLRVKIFLKKKKSNSINYPDSRVSVLNPEVGESGFHLSL